MQDLHKDVLETIFIGTLTSEEGATLLRSRSYVPFLNHLTKKMVSPGALN